MRVLNILSTFCQSEDGATAVEYCVMIALIVIAVIAGVTATGGGAGAWWGNIDSDLDTHGF